MSWPEALGIEPVDAAVAAVHAEDETALLALVAEASAACTTAFGAGGPPKCPEGVSDGTVVQYFPYFECDGWGSVDGAVNRLMDAGTFPLAVLKWDPPVASRTGEGQVSYAVLLAGGSPGGEALILTTLAFDGGKLREISGDCGAYSRAAFVAGELPDAASGAEVLWRAYPASGTR